jgi:hypothetical protein
MDFEVQFGNVPHRVLRVMEPQPIIAWTLPRFARAFIAWLMEAEQHHPSLMQRNDRLD